MSRPRAGCDQPWIRAGVLALSWLFTVTISGSAFAGPEAVTANTGILGRKQIPSEGVATERVFLVVPHLRQEPDLCVPTAAAMVVAYFGDPQPPRKLKVLSRGREFDPDKPFKDFTITWWRDLIAGMERLGYYWREHGFANTPEGFDEGIAAIKHNLRAENPVLADVALYGSHTLVIVGYDESTEVVYINDPNIPRPGIRRLTFDQLESIWNGLSYGVNGRPILFTQRKSGSAPTGVDRTSPRSTLTQ